MSQMAFLLRDDSYIQKSQGNMFLLYNHQEYVIKEFDHNMEVPVYIQKQENALQMQLFIIAMEEEELLYLGNFLINFQI